MIEKPFEKLGSIENFLIPIAGILLTFFLSLAIFSNPDLCNTDYKIVIVFALYTLFSTVISYAHRLLFKRHQKKEQLEGKKALTHLPPKIVRRVFIVT